MRFKMVAEWDVKNHRIAKSEFHSNTQNTALSSEIRLGRSAHVGLGDFLAMWAMSLVGIDTMDTP